MAELLALKCKRGVAKASIMKITTCLAELEGGERNAADISHAQLLLRILLRLDKEFRTHHLAIVEADEFAAEQHELDKHDETILHHCRSDLSLPGTSHWPCQLHCNFPFHVECTAETRVSDVKTAIEMLTPDPKEVHLVYLYAKQVREFKKEVADIHNNVLSLYNNKRARLCQFKGMTAISSICHAVTVKRLL